MQHEPIAFTLRAIPFPLAVAQPFTRLRLAADNFCPIGEYKIEITCLYTLDTGS